MMYRQAMLAVCLAVGFASYGPGPARGQEEGGLPQDRGGDEQSEARYNQEKAQAPAIQPDPEPTAGEHGKEAAKGTAKVEGGTPAEWLIADYTIVLAVATGALTLVAAIQAGLFLWQLKYMRKSVAGAEAASRAATITAQATKIAAEVGRTAAEAAKRSADALIKSEMAHVLVKHVAMMSNAKAGEFNPKLVTSIVNTGKTPAYVRRLALFYSVGRENLAESERGGVIELGYFLAPNEMQLPRNTFGDHTISVAEAEALTLEHDRAQFFVRGVVEFETTFNEVWESGFAYRVNFWPHPNPPEKQKNVAIPGRHFWRYAKRQDPE